MIILDLFSRKIYSKELWDLEPSARKVAYKDMNWPDNRFFAGSPFHYAAHLYNLCWLDDNCRSWQVAWSFEKKKNATRSCVQLRLSK
jgi:hypothetical protein